MADRLRAKWPVAELSALDKAHGRSYLSAREAADLYDLAYSTFVKQLKNFVQFGDFHPLAFQVQRRLSPRNRQYWMIEVHPVHGIRALNKHFYPRFFE